MPLLHIVNAIICNKVDLISRSTWICVFLCLGGQVDVHCNRQRHIEDRASDAEAVELATYVDQSD